MSQKNFTKKQQKPLQPPKPPNNIQIIIHDGDVDTNITLSKKKRKEPAVLVMVYLLGTVLIMLGFYQLISWFLFKTSWRIIGAIILSLIYFLGYYIYHQHLEAIR